jgi:hypothetical protein
MTNNNLKKSKVYIRDNLDDLETTLLLRQMNPKYPRRCLSRPPGLGAKPRGNWRAFEIKVERIEVVDHPNSIKTPHLLCSPMIWKFRQRYLNTVIADDEEYRRGAGIRAKDDPDLLMFFQTGDTKYLIESLRRWELVFFHKEFVQIQISWLRTIVEYAEFESVILPAVQSTFRPETLSPKVWRELLIEMEECLRHAGEEKEIVRQAKKVLSSISPLLVSPKSHGPATKFDRRAIKEAQKKLFNELKEFLSKGTSPKLRKGRLRYLNVNTMRLDIRDFLRKKGIKIEEPQINYIVQESKSNEKHQALGPTLGDVVFRIMACKLRTTPQSLRKTCSHEPQKLSDFLHGKTFLDFLRLI